MCRGACLLRPKIVEASGRSEHAPLRKAFLNSGRSKQAPLGFFNLQTYFLFILRFIEGLFVYFFNF
jgi:hypothetical protein